MSKCIATAFATIATLLSSGPVSAQESGESMSQTAIGAIAATAGQRAEKADKDLVELAMRYLDACVTRDVDYIAAHSIDEPEGSFSGFHSEPGPAHGLADNIGTLRGAKPVKWSRLNPEGFVVGDLAWFTDFAQAVVPSGRVDIRVTLIMKRSGADWKATHFHVSEGVRHEL